MTYPLRSLLLGTSFALAGTVAGAVTTDELVQRYQRDGYDWIEVTHGRSQIEVEAVRGTEEGRDRL